MKSRRMFRAVLVAMLISSAGRFAYAGEKIKPADVPSAATDAKYIEIPKGLEAAAEVGVYNAYVFAALEHEFTFLSDKIRLTPGVSSGWGSCTYNDYFFDTSKGALNDGNMYAELEYDLTETLTFGVSAFYMWLYDADIRDGAHDKYFDTKHWTFGVKLTYEM